MKLSMIIRAMCKKDIIKEKTFYKKKKEKKSHKQIEVGGLARWWQMVKPVGFKGSNLPSGTQPHDYQTATGGPLLEFPSLE